MNECEGDILLSEKVCKRMDLPELIHEVVDIMSGQLRELFGEESRVDDDHYSLCLYVSV